MNPYLKPVVAIVAGMALVAFSIIWPRLAPPSANWSDEQAAAFDKAFEQYRQALSQSPEGVESAERDQAKTRYLKLLEARNEALGNRVILAMVLQMLGVGVALIGSVAVIMRQNQAEDRAQQSA